jgi:uncharacterized protein YjiS (DUF1127 family)
MEDIMKSLAAVLALGSGSFFTDLNVSRVFQAFRIANERHSLGDLDEHMLRDIGLTREEAQTEAARPIWDLPAGR